ncbi:MAG: hypothetical protein JWO86_4118 [Myxococcaceae bacterium]|nr:hypothetical protein [Myxococcaceae bacterium]
MRNAPILPSNALIAHLSDLHMLEARPAQTRSVLELSMRFAAFGQALPRGGPLRRAHRPRSRDARAGQPRCLHTGGCVAARVGRPALPLPALVSVRRGQHRGARAGVLLAGRRRVSSALHARRRRAHAARRRRARSPGGRPLGPRASCRDRPASLTDRASTSRVAVAPRTPRRRAHPRSPRALPGRPRPPRTSPSRGRAVARRQAAPHLRCTGRRRRPRARSAGAALRIRGQLHHRVWARHVASVASSTDVSS